MQYQAVIFDLDGTLLYTLEDLYLAANHALVCLGLPPRTRDEIRSYIGNGYRRLFALACPAGTPDAVQEEALAIFNEYYLAHAQDHTAPYPGIPALLDRLQAAGVPLAVVSNKGDAAVCHLMDSLFPGTFQAVAGERAGVRRKPAPDTVNVVIDALGLTPADVVLIGDSEVDVATAVQANCACIAVTWGYRSVDELRAAGATVLVDSCEELAELLLND